jgi:16S rRNA (guanine1516-N2)-methyltransferase
MESLRIDFLSSQLNYRRKSWRGGGRCGRELIARAVGHKPGKGLKILDATAGFGVDAFVLAQLGHDVTMLERSPIIANLLQDALQRALEDDTCQDLKLRLINVDAIIYMEQLAMQYAESGDENALPDVIYLDPMYPTRSKSALNKQNMRILKDIVGEDLDAAVLFAAALKCAKKRVVVKRPRLAKRIDEGEAAEGNLVIRSNSEVSMIPTFVIFGKSCRYDVYQIAQKKQKERSS